MSISEAVRYLMDQCDKHGLHIEVLSEFLKEFESHFNENERLCLAGLEQIKPDFMAMANAALMEWDI